MPYRTPDAADRGSGGRGQPRAHPGRRPRAAGGGRPGRADVHAAGRAGRGHRQTLYRHWPARAALLLGLILEGADGGYPEPGADPGAVAAAWLASLRDGLRDQARRIAVLGVAAQADSDPDSAQALGQLTEYGNVALNELLQPSDPRSAVTSTRC